MDANKPGDQPRPHRQEREGGEKHKAAQADEVQQRPSTVEQRVREEKHAASKGTGSQQEGYSKESDRQARRMATATVWMAICTGAIFLATIGNIVVANWQVGVMKSTLGSINDQGHDIRTQASAAVKAADASATAAAVAKSALDQQRAATKTQLSKIQEGIEAQLELARQTRRFAIAAEKSATVARSSLAVSESQFRYAERPWVAIRGSFEPPNNKTPLTYDDAKRTLTGHFQAKNGGKSPAINVVTSGRYFWGPAEIDKFFSSLPRRPRYPGVYKTIILPGDEQTFGLGFGNVNRPEADFILGADGLLYLGVRLWYTDELGKPHHTDFCARFVSAKTGWVSCTTHNEAD